MPSLTPLNQNDQVNVDALQEGFVNALLTAVPSVAGVYLAMKNPRFMKVTNNSSRTALAIMPALFVFTYTAERKVIHRMDEIASENQHSYNTVEWMERQQIAQGVHPEQHKEELRRLYKETILDNTGIKIVPGETLQLHHKAANFVAENPFKLLLAIGVPAVAWIFAGRASAQNQHLTFAQKVMHTRVFGQFTIISSLLGIMGFKEYMDRNGKFVTEADAIRRVEDMQRVREEMLQRLDAKNKAMENYHNEIKMAHDQDVLEGNVHSLHKKKKHHKKKHHDQHEESSTDPVGDSRMMATSPKA